MIFAGLELFGEVPFTDVIIHSTLLAPDGRRMSKSLGTGIDPVDEIEKQGADALRYGLLKMSSTQDVRFNSQQIEEGRKLANKLWNASRLLLMAGAVEPDARPASVEEHWILGRIDATRQEIEDDFARFDFAHAVDRLYHLIFDDFCDWYLESIKPRLARGGRPRDGARGARAASQAPPSGHAARDRGDLDAAAGARVATHRRRRGRAARRGSPTCSRSIEAQTAARIYRRSQVRIKLDGDALRIFEAVVRPSADAEQGDIEAERARLQKEIDRAEKMLANEKFVANADPAAVEGEREKLAQYVAERDALA